MYKRGLLATATGLVYNIPDAGTRSIQTLTSSLSDQSQQLSPDHVITRTRRASMYDALDFTKIDASLYQRPVYRPLRVL